MSSVSLFIPFAQASHTADFIKNVIENKARLGKVEQIDVVTKMNSTRNKYNIAYVYFDRWNDDEPTKKFLTDLKSSNNNKPIIRFEKDFGNSMCPTYWNVFENILVEQRKKTFIPLKSQDEFPVLGTPTRKVRFENVPLQSLHPPPAPRKASVNSCVRNLNNEYDEAVVDTMNLVDTGYVVRLEEENRRLREENDRIIQFYKSQVNTRDKEISQMWEMMYR
jgi:hypothetical protein